MLDNYLHTEQQHVLGIPTGIYGVWYWHFYCLVEPAQKEKNLQTSAASRRRERLVCHSASNQHSDRPLVQYPRHRQRKFRHDSVKAGAILRHHLISAAHGANNGVDRGSGCVFKMLPRF